MQRLGIQAYLYANYFGTDFEYFSENDSKFFADSQNGLFDSVYLFSSLYC